MDRRFLLALISSLALSACVDTAEPTGPVPLPGPDPDDPGELNALSPADEPEGFRLRPLAGRQPSR